MQFLGIGQVGLGGITQAHRAGYRLFNQPLVGGYDPDPAAGQRLLADSPGATAYASLDDLLADDAIGVIDLSTPHHAATRVPVVAEVAAAGKPVLIQKPFGYNYADCLRMVEQLEAAGVTGMVNQNMCFTPGALDLIDVVMRQREIGDPTFAQVTLQYQFDTGDHPWFGKDERWWTGALTVHHFGLMQLLFGPPQSVYAVTGADVSQPGVPIDGYGHLLLRYPNGMSAAVTSTGTYFGVDSVPHGNENIWIQADRGLVDWRANDGMTISHRNASDPSEIDRTALPGRGPWFPNAFGLVMTHFREALQACTEPLCSVQDNLYVMALIEAAYQSSAKNAVVDMASIMGERYDPAYGTGWEHGYTDWTVPTPAAEVAADA